MPQLLERLAALPDRRCCFEIDLMLKRHEKAVVHAIKGGEGMWDDARAVAEEHGLYKVAVQQLRQLLPARQEHLNQALLLYGGYLSERGEHKMAGLVMKAAGKTNEATTELLQDAMSWEAGMLLLQEGAHAPSAADIQRQVLGSRASGFLVSGFWFRV